MKKIFSTFLLTLGLFTIHGTAFGVEVHECDTKEGYELYKCRNELICDIRGRKPEKLIYDSDASQGKYEQVEPGNIDFFVEAKTRYRTNMNNLYKCSLIQLRINALKEIDGLDKAEEIRDRTESKIKQQISKLERQQKTLCANIDKTTTSNKQAVLQQATYEVCKYLNYLEYLDDHTDSLSNIIGEGESIGVVELSNEQTAVKNAIQEEFEHSIKVFPLAFTAYSQYENNISIHLMLELIREDFTLFRKRLHSILGPISQLVYKANNAMGK